MANTITFDLSDYNKSVQQMDELGDSTFPYCGENADGETTLTSVFSDKIVHQTFQRNNWARINTLYRGGTREESFEKIEEV